MNFQGLKFEIGFWHPFGPHAGETAEEIIKRKQREIKKNGWTLWSFQHRKVLGTWYKNIRATKARNVLVFCSNGKGAKDARGSKKYCRYYTPTGSAHSVKIPRKIKVPHPMGKMKNGSAFMVKKIIYPTDGETPSIMWLKDGKWQTEKLPTRPEYLIKPGRGISKKNFRAVLVLKAPYLAEVFYARPRTQ